MTFIVRVVVLATSKNYGGGHTLISAPPSRGRSCDVSFCDPREKRELTTRSSIIPRLAILSSPSSLRSPKTNHHLLSTLPCEMIMFSPTTIDSGFDSGSSPEVLQHQHEEPPMSRTAQYRKVCVI